MMKTNRVILPGLVIAISAMFTACSSLGKYQEITGVSDNLYGNVALSETSLGQFSWREIFTDSLLRDFIDTALVRNYDLQAAQEHIIQAEAQLTAAKLAYIPTLGLSPTYSRNFAGDDFGTISNSYNLNAAASWQLSLIRLGANLSGAKAGVEQMEDYRQAARSRLIASVANAYFTLLMLDAQRETAIDMKNIWQKSVETIQILKDEGMADGVAVSQYVSNFHQACATISDLEGQIRKTENAFNQLLSFESGHPIVRGRLEEQVLSHDIVFGAPVQMLTLRPDVRAAQREMEKAFYTTKGAILNYFPSLSINGSIGLVNPVTGEISPMSLLANVGAGLTAPILNAGKNRSALELAKSRQRETRILFNQTLLAAGMDVNSAYGMYSSSTKKEADNAKSVVALKKACEDTEYLMVNSLDKTYLDVLYARSSYFSNRLELISNRAQRLQAYVNIYTALGGGAID